jgi:hypothetical protein
MARASSSLRISIWVKSRGMRSALAASPTSPNSSRHRASTAEPVMWRPLRAFTA